MPAATWSSIVCLRRGLSTRPAQVRSQLHGKRLEGGNPSHVELLRALCAPPVAGLPTADGAGEKASGSAAGAPSEVRVGKVRGPGASWEGFEVVEMNEQLEQVPRRAHPTPPCMHAHARNQGRAGAQPGSTRKCAALTDERVQLGALSKVREFFGLEGFPLQHLMQRGANKLHLMTPEVSPLALVLTSARAPLHARVRIEYRCSDPCGRAADCGRRWAPVPCS